MIPIATKHENNRETKQTPPRIVENENLPKNEFSSVIRMKSRKILRRDDWDDGITLCHIFW